MSNFECLSENLEFFLDLSNRKLHSVENEKAWNAYSQTARFLSRSLQSYFIATIISEYFVFLAESSKKCEFFLGNLAKV